MTRPLHEPKLAHPRCPGCGHNYYELPAEPVLPDGSARKAGLCHWCLAEEDGTINTPDYQRYDGE
jgi:hypothetical protein